MTNKIQLCEELPEEQSKKPVIITFTMLYSMKQAGIERLIKENGVIYINCKDGPPLKITTATLG